MATVVPKYLAGKIYFVDRLPPYAEVEVGTILRYRSSGHYVTVVADFGGLPKAYIKYVPPNYGWVAGELYQAPGHRMPPVAVDLTQFATWDSANTATPQNQTTLTPDGTGVVYRVEGIQDAELKKRITGFGRKGPAAALTINNFAGIDGLKAYFVLFSTVNIVRQDYIGIENGKIKLGFVDSALCEFIVLFNKPVKIDHIKLDVPELLTLGDPPVKDTKLTINTIAEVTSTRPDGTAWEDDDLILVLRDVTGYPAGDYRYNGGTWVHTVIPTVTNPVGHLGVDFSMLAYKSHNPLFGDPIFNGLTDRTNFLFQELDQDIPRDRDFKSVLFARTELVSPQTGLNIYPSFLPSGSWEFETSTSAIGFEFKSDYSTFSYEPAINPDYPTALFISEITISLEDEGHVYIVRSKDTPYTYSEWEGVSLSDGHVVDLTDQNVEGGWELIEVAGRSVTAMDTPPTPYNDETEGFRPRTSKWITQDRRVYFCKSATRGSAIWELQSSDRIKSDTGYLSFEEGGLTPEDRGVYLLNEGQGYSSSRSFIVSQNRSVYSLFTPIKDAPGEVGAMQIGRPFNDEFLPGVSLWRPSTLEISGGGNLAETGAVSDTVIIRTQDAGIDARGGNILFSLGAGRGAQGVGSSAVFQFKTPAAGGALGSLVFQFGTDNYCFPATSPGEYDTIVFDKVSSSYVAGDLTLRDVTCMKWGANKVLYTAVKSYPGLVGDTAIPSELSTDSAIRALPDNEYAPGLYLVELGGKWTLARLQKVPMVPGGLGEFIWRPIESTEDRFVWDEDQEAVSIVGADGRLDKLTADKEIIRSAVDPPTVSLTKPAHEKWIKETRRKIFQWIPAEVGGQYRHIPVPTCCLYNPDTGKHEERFHLNKPGQVIRSLDLPPDNEATWEYWVRETATSLFWFVRVDIRGNSEALPLPWFHTFDADTGQIIDHYEFIKPVSSSPPEFETAEFGFYRTGQPTTFPEVLTTKPNWEFWIHEGDFFVRRYTHAYVDGAYRLIPIPWSFSYNAATGVITQEYQLQKPDRSDFSVPNSSTGNDVIRNVAEPVVAGLPDWEVYVQESAAEIAQYTHMLIGDTYERVGVPWATHYNSATGLFEKQFILSKV